MRSLSVVARNFSLVAIAQIITLGASFFFTLAQARFLGPARFGELSVALSVSAILTLVIDFGLGSKLPRDVAQRPEAAGQALVASFVVRGAIWVAAVPVVWAATTVLGYGPELQSSVLILSLSVLFSGFAASLVGYFQGREQFVFPSLGMVSQRATAATLGVGALALGYGAPVVAAMYVVASVVQVVVMLPGLRKYPVSPTTLERHTVIDMVRGTATLGFFWMLGAFYYNVDLLILQRLMPAENVAWYAAAYRLFGVALAVVSFASSAVLYPAISRLSIGPRAELRRAMERSFTFLLGSGIFVALVVAIAAEQIVALVFPARDYGPAASALRLLAPAIAAMYANGPFFLVLLGMHSDRGLLAMAATLAVLNPLANIIAIPLYGQNASALLTSATELAVLGWVIALTPRDLRGAADPRVVVRLFAAALPAAMSLWLLHPLPVLVSVPLASVVYVAAALACGAVPADDVRAVRALVLRRRTAADATMDSSLSLRGAPIRAAEGVSAHVE